MDFGICTIKPKPPFCFHSKADTSTSIPEMCQQPPSLFRRTRSVAIWRVGNAEGHGLLCHITGIARSACSFLGALSLFLVQAQFGLSLCELR
jgi:hypothetical protein